MLPLSLAETSGQRRLALVRHGATAANLARLRCGGDLDVPLTELGRQQALTAAHRAAALDPPIGVIVTSDLQRTRDTAAIIARALGGLAIVVEPGFAERRLGSWNLLPIDESEAVLQSEATPPGGESSRDFSRRIAAALPRLMPHLAKRPLLVSSKGVARVLGDLLGQPLSGSLSNGEITDFDLTPLAPLSFQCTPP